MTEFNESFYTDDFDQKMLDYIEENYETSSGWNINDKFLKFDPNLGYFWLSACEFSHWSKLTKQQFKEKIGMKQFNKSDLKDGMRITYRNGWNLFVFMGRLYKYHESTFAVNYQAELSDYEEDLTWFFGNNEFDIMTVTDQEGNLLFEREDDTEVTMQEIADKFNIPLEQLRIKD